MDQDVTQIIWSEKYRPLTIDDCVLPDNLKKDFTSIRDSGKLPHLLLAGPAGTGKTTVAKALCKEMGIDVYYINASLNGNIDTLRTEIVRYASTVSLSGSSHKAIILDEADYLNPNSTQPALRGVTQEFASVCSFIFTCNFPNKIIEPLHSRCKTYNFQYKSKEKPKLAKQIYSRIISILDQEGVDYKKDVVTQLVLKYFPDFRKMINEIQAFSSSGTLDESVLLTFDTINIDQLASAMADKDFSKMRKWVVQNVDNDVPMILRKIYDTVEDYMEPDSIPLAIVHLADGQYKSAFVADQEINLVATLTNLMAECDWKK